jgi:hypothetical protein
MGGDVEGGSAGEADERDPFLHEARSGYERLVKIHRDSGLACIIAASFHQHHSPFHVDEAENLANAMRLSSAIDVQFHCHQRLRNLRQSDQGLSVIDRILVEQKMRQVGHLRVDAYRLLAAMWTGLCGDIPDLSLVSENATSLYAAIDRIDALYSGLLSINGDSVTVLRGYASFLDEFRGDVAHAAELLNRAERSEDTAAVRDGCILGRGVGHPQLMMMRVGVLFCACAASFGFDQAARVWHGFTAGAVAG